jgi:hypothetical protein
LSSNLAFLCSSNASASSFFCTTTSDLDRANWTIWYCQPCPVNHEEVGSLAIPPDVGYDGDVAYSPVGIMTPRTYLVACLVPRVCLHIRRQGTRTIGLPYSGNSCTSFLARFAESWSANEMNAWPRIRTLRCAVTVGRGL